MEDIYVLSQDLKVIGIIDSYSSLIWANRYNSDGDCEIYIEASKENLELLQEGNVLIRDDDDMACKIKFTEIETEAENGNFLTIKAYDVKNILGQRIIWQQTNLKGKAEDCIYNLVEANLINPTIEQRKIKNTEGKEMFFLDEKQNFTEVMTCQSTYSNLEKRIQEICQERGWGYKVIVKEQGYYFSIYKGADRSSKVIFSPEFENLQSTRYIKDSTNIANVALVGGEGEGAKRAKSIKGSADGIDRYEIFVDAKDISRTITWEELIKLYPQGDIEKQAEGVVYKMDSIDIKIIDQSQFLELTIKYPDGEEIEKDGEKYYRVCNAPIATLQTEQPEDTESVILEDIIYSTYLLSRGSEKIAEYGQKESFEGEIEPTSTFEYKKDYFLGDLVTVCNEYGIERKVRITEIIEIKDDNGYRVEPKFEYVEE